MGGAIKYIVILAVGFVLGYEFTSQGERVSSAIEAGTITKSSVLKQFNEVMSEVSSDRKVLSEKSYESFRDQDQKIDLSTYSFHDLSVALKNKDKAFQKEVINQYELDFETTQNSQKIKDEILDQLVDLASQSSNWKGSMEVLLNGETAYMDVVARYYGKGGADFDGDSLDISKMEDPTICWLAVYYIKYKEQKLRMSSSDCTARAYKENTYYMTINVVHAPGINNLLYYMMVPFPGGNGDVEYLIPNDKTYYKSSITWSASTKEYADKSFENNKDYEWVH